MLDYDINAAHWNLIYIRINIANNSKWQCSSPFEDSIHYIMECPLHQNERDCLSRH